MEALKFLIVFSALTNLVESDDKTINWKQTAEYFDNNARTPLTFRLPNNTKPQFYSLHIKTEVDQKEFKFSGNVKIDIAAMVRTSTVTLHSRDLTIEKIALLDSNEQIVNDNLQFEYIQPKLYDFLLIQLPRDMEKNEFFTLDIDFAGQLNDDETGFYRAFYYDEYGKEENNKIYYAVTQFQPIYARKAFPCYDEVGLRANFAVQIQHAKEYHAYSNTELVSETPVAGTNQVISKFRRTPSMQAYTVAFIVAPFDELSNNDRRVPQRIIARATAIKYGEANFAAEQVGPLLRKMEEQVGITFPLTKLDHVAVDPLRANGMDNWGLAVYREYCILIEHNLTVAQKFDAEKYALQIISHENAHQFFGNLVAPHWWTDLWLNEGFATLFEYYIPHLVFPDYGYMDHFRKSELELAFKIDVLNKYADSLPLSFYVESPSGIESNFDSISYSKGAAVLRMFQAAYGYKTFKKAIKLYFQRRLYLVAEPKDLYSSLQQAVDEDIPSLQHNVEREMGRWVNQPGYPLVSVSFDNQFIVFEQHRFPKPKKDEIYSIPLSYATKKNPNFNITVTHLWLSQKEMRVPVGLLYTTPKDWIIFNVQQTGFYRVNYSPKMWQLIAGGLREDINAIHPINREVLMAELKIAFFSLDEILISDVFEVMMFLSNEDQFLVWDEVEKIITQIQFNFVGTESYDDFLKFMQYISRKQMKRLGFADIPGESPNDSQLRGVMIDYNCFAADALCHDYQLDQLKLLLNGNTKVDFNFCAAFSNAPQNAFNFLLHFVATEKDPEIRIFYLLGLTCSRDVTQLQQLIKTFENKTNEFTGDDVIIAISKMFLTSPEAQTEALEYLERYPEILANEQVRDTLKQSINTIAYEERVKKVVKSARFGGSITSKEATEVVGGMGERNYWHARNYKSAVEWFKKQSSLI